MNRPVVVTGGIASGKSTVCGMFEELGLRVGSADAVAGEVFGDEVVQEFLRNELGEGDLRELARGRMGDFEFRRRLNGVMHPLIWSRLRDLDVDVIEVPLLVEAGLVSAFGRVLVCECLVDVVLERLEARLGEREVALRLVGSQVGIGVRRIFGDEVIRTDEGMDSVRTVVRTLANLWF